jgi:inward rectifier potassium channel
MLHHKQKQPQQRVRPRLVPRDGRRRFKVVRIGAQRFMFRDLYARYLAMPWWALLLIVLAFYLVSNLLFAGIYYLNRPGVENAHSFMDMFFFSVQTMATIGYGKMTPVSFAANLIVAIEAFWGFAYFALVMGLMFAKFSRPTARVLFSNVAVISDFEGIPHLKIRLANQRNNRISDATANLYLLSNTITKEGYTMRRFLDLALVRGHLPLLQLTWTLLHPIDEQSPLYGLTHEQLDAAESEIIVSLVGLDETLSQTIQARHSYIADEIIHDAFFEDVLTRNDRGLEVNYNLFHSVRRAEAPPPDNNGKTAIV